MPYSQDKHGGAEVFLSNVADTLAKREDVQIVKIISGKKAQSEKIISIPTLKTRVGRVISEQLLLPMVVRKLKLDVLLSNYVVPVFAPCENIAIIHDMIYRKYPRTLEKKKLIYWRAFIPLTILVSRSIITVSEFSKKEIVSAFPLALKKTYVCVEGVKPSMVLAQGKFSKRIINEKYVLCVATFGKHKNIINLVDAFSRLNSGLSKIQLVLVGAARTPDAREYRLKIKLLIQLKNLNSKVVFLDHVSDFDLANLYHNAECLVLPSLYEGFGLPIIEAQYNNCPVICSSEASLPEIAGNSALYFNPKSADSIKNALENILFDSHLRAQLQSLGWDNIKQFTWAKAAEQVLYAIDKSLER
ncbi:MAG: glycosyltransferase family 4 protein [Candidatus Heimdallarchaeota archaeon]|nr:glycosyltransferase family 4 protein [Candidatus Heimdallarchaeota archaeon]